MRSASVLVMAAVAGVLVGAGCGPKFTRPRYETVYVGQPAVEVRKTLGEPTFDLSDEWNYVNSSPFYKAVIYFRDGRVIRKLWFDERHMPDLPTQDELKAAPAPGSGG